MAIRVNCERCMVEIEEQSVLIFGVPDNNMCRKFHVCTRCWWDSIRPALMAPIISQTNEQVIDDLVRTGSELRKLIIWLLRKLLPIGNRPRYLAIGGKWVHVGDGSRSAVIDALLKEMRREEGR